MMTDKKISWQKRKELEEAETSKRAKKTLKKAKKKVAKKKAKK